MEKKQRSALTVTLMMGATLLSKVFALLRTVFMANRYGTGVSAQAFSQASHIPLTLFDIAFGAAVLGCFIPVYNSIRKSAEKQDEFALTFFNFILLASSSLALIGIIFAPQVIGIMAPGLEDEVKELAVRLLRIMFPMIVFTGGTYTLVGLMQSKGSYLLPASVSAISNGCVVIYLVFIDKYLGENGIFGLAAVYLLAWLIQLLTLAIPLMRKGFRFRPRIDFKDPNLAKSLKMAPSIMFGSWLSPFSILIGLFFASFLKTEGANTIFDYSYTIFALIAIVLSNSLCNYAFPILSKAEGEEWDNTVRKGLTAAAAIIIPFTGAVAVLAGEGVSVLLMRGEFSPESAALTANSIRFMLFGLPSFALVEVGNRVFYSRKMTVIPMLSALAGIGANVLLTLILVNFTSLETVSLSLGYAAGLLSASVFLLVFMIVKFRSVFDKTLITKIIKVVCVSAVSTAVMAVVYHFLPASPFDSSLIKNILILAGTFVPGAAVYLAGIKLLKVI